MLELIGIGTGTKETLSLKALEELVKGETVYLQTGTVPVAELLQSKGVAFETFDSYYEKYEDFDELYARAAEAVLDVSQPVVGVLGAVTQNRLAQELIALAKKRGISYEIIPGMAFGSEAADRAELSGAIQEITATDFLQQTFSTNKALVITEVDTVFKAADIKLKLGRFYPADFEVTVLRGSEKRDMPLQELDRLKELDYSTAIAVPPLDFRKKCGFEMDDLIDILHVLRAPEGCPWDREQTHESLRPYLLEESYEVLDAIAKKDAFMLSDELGDVLLQVVFHAQIAAEEGEFDMTDVISSVCQKMISRHTHVFADDRADTANDVMKNWEVIKQKEKKLSSYTESLRDIPFAMSALMRAAKIQKKAAAAGFDWPEYTGALEKVEEELNEVRQAQNDPDHLEEELGDLLFATVNLIRLLGLNAEVALSGASEKFIDRFAKMEEISHYQLKGLTLDQMDKLWEEAKKRETHKNTMAKL